MAMKRFNTEDKGRHPVKSKYIKNAKIIEIKDGQVRIEITLDPLLFLSDVKEILNNMVEEFAKITKEFKRQLEMACKETKGVGQNEK